MVSRRIMDQRRVGPIVSPVVKTIEPIDPPSNEGAHTGTPRPSIDDNDGLYADIGHRGEDILRSVMHRKQTIRAAQTFSTAPVESDDDSSTAEDGSVDSMSLTDLHPMMPRGRKGNDGGNNSNGNRPCPPTVRGGDNKNSIEDSVSSGESHIGNTTVSASSGENDMNSNINNGNGPLPQPPNHFLCPIQNTLLQDPVIDKEGNTYEREAILRWLVLTSTNFEGGNDDGKNVSKGTSPITGNPMSVDELVEDRVVKSAIQRWQKEAWVRFTLANKSYGEKDERVQFLVEEDEPDSKGEGGEGPDASGRSGECKDSIGKFKERYDIDEAKAPDGRKKGNRDNGKLGHSMTSQVSHKSHCSRTSHKSHGSKDRGGSSNKREDKDKNRHGHKHHDKHHDNHHDSKHKEHKERKTAKAPAPPEGIPRVVVDKAIAKQYPPPPPRRQSPAKRQERQTSNGRSSSHNSGRDSHHGSINGSVNSSVNSRHRSKGSVKSSLSSSQKTAVTSNTTPPITPKAPHHMHNSAAGTIPPPPFLISSIPESPNVPIREIVPSVDSFNLFVDSSADSCCSNLSNPNDLFSVFTMTTAANQTKVQNNGWSVPLGVHKVVCASPGLRVSKEVHRRSVPVKVATGILGRDGAPVRTELVIPPGSYVDVLETQVHGDRVRGRILWEVEEEDPTEADKKKDKSIKGRTTRLLKRRSRRKQRAGSEERTREVAYEGWISLQWARGEEEKDAEEKEDERSGAGSGRGSAGTEGHATDEDSGPWTEPVPLGVYRINFGGGLPLRETPERDSAVLGKLDRGQCIEVVQTEVKGDRVRARVMVPNGAGFTSGWISLLNALTGSGGASPVPLGAYVIVAETGCAVTEGGRLDSKIRTKLAPGSCMEVVATRMEEGLVRGLVASGGHVTLFAPPGAKRGAAPEGGAMLAMPVPLGTYQIVQGKLPMTSRVASTSPVVARLPLDAAAEVVETRVEDGRVRGRIAGSDGAAGWIDLFEPNRRWARIICFRGGRPVGSGSGPREKASF